MEGNDRLDALIEVLSCITAATKAEAEQLILEYGKIPSFESFIERAKSEVEVLCAMQNQRE